MKKTILGISLTALAIVAVLLVPATTADVQASADGVYSDAFKIISFCEKNVCINAADCESTSDDLGCQTVGAGCNTYRCEASVEVINN